MPRPLLADDTSLKSPVKFHEVVSKPLPVSLALVLFVATVFLSTASGAELAKLGLSALIENYRWAVGLGLVIALTWLAATGMIWMIEWIYRETSAELGRLQTMRRRRVRVENEIPKMTAKEREIVGCLVAKNQRTFTNSGDGGYASSLISKGVVVLAVGRGRAFLQSEVPFEVPEHVWKILLEHKGEFPYVVPKGGSGLHPWRTP